MRAEPHRATEAEAPGPRPRKHVGGVRLGKESTANVQPQNPALNEGRQCPCALCVQLSGPAREDVPDGAVVVSANLRATRGSLTLPQDWHNIAIRPFL